MDIQRIQLDVLSVYKRCNIKSFPINCCSIINQYGFQFKSYTDLSEKKRAACMILSEDACIIQDTLYYNDDRLEGRIRFSIMHELGHLILDTDSEQDANSFASHILAPRMVIHFAGCKNCDDVAKHFHMTHEAADYAFNDYRRWRRIAAYKASFTDNTIYNYFFDKSKAVFIYHINYCSFCNKEIYNNHDAHICPLCRSKQYQAEFSSDKIPDSMLYSYLGID